MADHHSDIDNQIDEDSFYDKSQKNDADNIPSRSEAFKNGKTRFIRKKKGHTKQSSNLQNLETNKQEQLQNKVKQKAEQRALQIISQMQNRYEEDLKLYEQKSPAIKKLTYLKYLVNELKDILVWDKFLYQGGLQQIQLWFTKLPSGIEPSLTVRKELLQLLDSLKIKSEHIQRVESIKKVVQKHKKSQIKELRELSEAILLKWSKTQHEEDNQ